MMNWYAVDHRFLVLFFFFFAWIPYGAMPPFDLMFSIIARLSSSTSAVISRNTYVFMFVNTTAFPSSGLSGYPNDETDLRTTVTETPHTTSIQNRRKYPVIHEDFSQ